VSILKLSHPIPIELSILASHLHMNDSCLPDGRCFHVSHRFTEVEIQVNTNFSFTLIARHLKSRRLAPEAKQRLKKARTI
jgi:hypothetical protein